jgi:peroxiredoxin
MRDRFTGGIHPLREIEVMNVNDTTTAPDFELSNQFGEPIRLSSFRGVRPVALVFFPLAFTGICTSELCELRDNLGMFQSRGMELLAVSVDSKATLREFAEREGYEFSLLADFWPHGAVARDFGVFDTVHGTAERATFVIDAEGVIRSRILTPRGRARTLDAYQEALAALDPAE